MKWDGEKVRWAPKVSGDLLRRVYHNDAAGLIDDELLSEVTLRIWERCQDIVRVTEASEGRATCPRCLERIVHAGNGTNDVLLECRCGWSLKWSEYHRSYKKRQLHGGSAIAFYQAYVLELPAARTPKQKMLALDSLITSFHRWAERNLTRRPAAANFVDGNLRAVVSLLDELSGGTNADLTLFRSWAEQHGAFGPRDA